MLRNHRQRQQLIRRSNTLLENDSAREQMDVINPRSLGAATSAGTTNDAVLTNIDNFTLKEQESVAGSG